MISSRHPVKVYFIKAFSLFCFCPPPPIFKDVCNDNRVISTFDTKFVVDAVGFYVWFWNNVEPVGVVDALKKLAEIYHQLFKNRRKLFLSNLLTLQQWYLIIPLELFRVHMFKFLHKMVRQILVFLFLLLL